MPTFQNQPLPTAHGPSFTNPVGPYSSLLSLWPISQYCICQQMREHLATQLKMIGVYISDQTSERQMIINGASVALHVQADASEILLAFTWERKRADTASKQGNGMIESSGAMATSLLFLLHCFPPCSCLLKSDFPEPCHTAAEALLFQSLEKLIKDLSFQEYHALCHFYHYVQGTLVFHQHELSLPGIVRQ